MAVRLGPLGAPNFRGCMGDARPHNIERMSAREQPAPSALLRLPEGALWLAPAAARAEGVRADAWELVLSFVERYADLLTLSLACAALRRAVRSVPASVLVRGVHLSAGHWAPAAGCAWTPALSRRACRLQGRGAACAQTRSCECAVGWRRCGLSIATWTTQVACALPRRGRGAMCARAGVARLLAAGHPPSSLVLHNCRWVRELAPAPTGSLQLLGVSKCGLSRPAVVAAAR